MNLGSIFTSCLALIATLAQSDTPPVGTLEAALAGEDAAALAREAREHGDARRGAIIFYQPQLTCARCHDPDAQAASLGPELAKLGDKVSDSYLVEAILDPSKVIKKGFESITLATDQGITITGLLVESRPEAVVLRDIAADGKLITIAREQIEAMRANPQSIMPRGLVGQLASRQQFLDLVRYLMDIVERGPDRARELRSAAAQLSAPSLPAYEQEIDHAGLIRRLDPASLERGEVIYKRLCINCHGTREQPGSLPTSLRFATGKFKNGSDPYSMYRTLTYGFGMMAAQSWMVPRQKYEVIHYIREAYLRDSNPTEYPQVDEQYLSRLPQGTTDGPEPTIMEPWITMDYGPSLMGTIELGPHGNIAYKGIAIRLDPGAGGVSRGRRWIVYDHDTLRAAGAWSGQGFIDWNGIHFNGLHDVHPRAVGRVHWANPVGPGWADPETGSFEDPRLRGRDGRRYGPLPRRWAHYKGTYHFGQQTIIAYTVGQAEILEMPGYEEDSAAPDHVTFTRTLNISPTPRDLKMRVAPLGCSVALVGSTRARLLEESGFTVLHVPASESPLALKLLICDGARRAVPANAAVAPVLLAPFTVGGPRRWPETLKTDPVRGADNAPFAVDRLSHPDHNPWLCQVRLSGFDFFPDGNRVAMCTWDGDVWLVSGIDRIDEGLHWQRIASGLFQPLGLRIVNGQVYVTCRDQLVVLHDLNGDGETDFYENFNNDHQVTEHFHEFAMDLQTDEEGNFYYTKAARHAKTALVPHHGTLLRVSRDGSRSDVLATGFRAPNGVCLNPDGTFFISDQEGHWIPKNRINWVKPGGFYGNMWGYHDVTDSSDDAMEQPLCWITNRFDRSPAELLWVDSAAWGPLHGALLNLSYGYGKIFVVPHERVNGQIQGGMCQLPIASLPTGIMRGRFHPHNGQLYACGMFAWAGNQTQPGGFYRIRYTNKPVYLPLRIEARRDMLAITFTAALDPESAGRPDRFAIETWSLRRSANYGSEHTELRSIKVKAARLTPDRRTVLLELPGLAPTRCMEIRYALEGSDGEPVEGLIHNTIHQLRE